MEFLEILKIILLGIVEGITEWLPVSSTGHMILLNYFLPLKDVSTAFTDMFEYVVQLAAILAVVIIFWKRIFPIGIKNSVDNNINDNGATDTVTAPSTNAESKKLRLFWKKDILNMWLKVLIACIPAVLGLLIDWLFQNLSPVMETAIIAATLILYGIAFVLIETFNKSDPKIKEISQLSYKYAFFIGCFQLLAAIPGTSRSGITIIGALLLGVSRTAAAEFTFFLAIPTMLAASAYKLLKFLFEAGTMSGSEISYLLIGSVVAFAVSLFTVKFLMNFVKKHDFKIFGWYRIALGAIVLLTLLLSL